MDDRIAIRLAAVPTGTLATVLRQMGLSRIWMQGPRPILATQGRIAGRALTVRFVPAREDLTTTAALAAPNSLRHLIDKPNRGRIMVASTGGIQNAGVIGDILAARMLSCGVKGLVTDGVIRDLDAIANVGLPVWATGSAAPPSLASLHYCESNVLIGCAGVAIAPDDYIVADQDGAVVVPAAVAAGVVAAAEEKEEFEAWVLARVKAGESLVGLYPPSEDTKARYARALKARKRARQ